MHSDYDNPTIDRLRALPKAEVHVHLEGCFEVELLAHWARKFSEPTPRPRESLFRFEGLADFLHFLEREYALCRDTFVWSDDVVRSVARTSIDACFANDDVKARLRDALSRW